MKKNAHNKFVYPLISFLFILSCSAPPPDEKEGTLRLVYTDWSESVAITYLAAVLLEENLGYTIELKLTDIESAYKEVAEGEADAFTDAWLPETHQKYVDEYTTAFERIGLIYPHARTGFVVPAYSRLQTISDLKDYSNPIIGIDKGAGVMQKARQVIDLYKLPGKLLSLSENEMISHLEDSIRRRKEIVITGWEPHWIFARYEVKFLEDPDAVFGVRESIYIIGRNEIEEKHPRAVRFFERMQLTESQLNQLIYQVKLSEDPLQGVKTWINENEHVVNQWIKNLQPDRKKVM